MKKIVVIGSTGQLGSELCKQLGDQAIGLSHKSIDITNLNQVRSILKNLQPKFVINAAGIYQCG